MPPNNPARSCDSNHAGANRHATALAQLQTTIRYLRSSCSHRYLTFNNTIRDQVDSVVLYPGVCTLAMIAARAAAHDFQSAMLASSQRGGMRLARGALHRKAWRGVYVAAQSYRRWLPRGYSASHLCRGCGHEGTNCALSLAAALGLAAETTTTAAPALALCQRNDNVGKVVTNNHAVRMPAGSQRARGAQGFCACSVRWS